MILSFKGRPVPQPGDRVKAYRRLTGPNSDVVKWSLMDPRTRLVLAHADEALLRDVTFTVNESGRLKVIETGRKNVHAFAVGTLRRQEVGDFWMGDTGVHYNPKVSGSFLDDTGEPVDMAKKVLLDTDGKMWAV